MQVCAYKILFLHSYPVERDCIEQLCVMYVGDLGITFDEVTEDFEKLVTPALNRMLFSSK